MGFLGGQSMTGGVFELSVNPINAVIGSAIVAGLTLFAYYQYPNLLDKFEAEFIRRFGHLLGLTENTSNKELLKEVFYKYNHSSTKSWIQWMMLADIETREKAFLRLRNYVQRPQSKLGSITSDVVLSLGAIKHNDGISTLHQFLQETRETWGQYKAAMLAYEPALEAINHLDPEQAKNVILTELQSCANQKDYEGIKELLINKYTDYDFDKDNLNFYIDLMLDTEQNYRVKNHLIKRIEEKLYEEKELIYSSILNSLLEKTKQGLASANDATALKLMLPELTTFIEKNDYEIWHNLMLLLDCDGLGEPLQEWLEQNLNSKEPIYSRQQLYNLINSKEKHASKFKEAIAQKFELSNEEKAIIKEPIPTEHYQFRTDTFSVSKYSQEIIVPLCLKRNYENLRKQTITEAGMFKPSKNIKLIAGDSVETKLFLIRALVASTKRHFIYIDFRKLILSPDLVSELTKEVQINKPCVIFVRNLIDILELSSDHRLSKKIETAMATLKKICQIGGIDLIAESSMSFIDTRRKYGNDFEVIDEICATGYRERKELYRFYDFILSNDREANVFDIDNFIEATSKLSTMAYISKLLQYLKISLLTAGTLISIGEYNKLVDASLAIEQEELPLGT